LKVISWDHFAEYGLSHLESTESTDTEAFKGSACAIGVFDGLHLGHQALLSMIQHKGLYRVVVTFRHNPKAKRSGATYHGDIFSLKRKLELLEEARVDALVLIDFSQEFSRMTGKDFLSVLWKNSTLRYLAVGHDFRCGYGLDTDSHAIRSFGTEVGFKTEVLDAVLMHDHPVSSSRVRQAIARGDFHLAETLLSRPYELDLRSFPYEDNTKSCLVSLLACSQVLPPNGEYACVHIQEAKRTLVKLTLTNESVEIFQSPGSMPGLLQFCTQ